MEKLKELITAGKAAANKVKTQPGQLGANTVLAITLPSEVAEGIVAELESTNAKVAELESKIAALTSAASA